MSVIDINGLRVSYTDTGSGAPIVFVPGLAGSGEWFQYQSSGLSDRFRVITYDLPQGTRYSSLDSLADDLARFLAAIRVYYSAVIGHSLGGMIALKYAIAHPERCPALVLCSTAPTFSEVSDEDLAALLLPEGFKPLGFWERLAARFSRQAPQAAPQDDVQGFLSASISGLSKSTLNSRIRLMRETDLTPELPKVEVPSLIIVSAGDEPHILSGSQALHQGIDGANIEVTEGTDRFYFYTRHDLFNAILADYLTETISHY